MIKQAVPLYIRSDPAGDGHYGAPRGARTHRGVDYQCTPGCAVLSPVQGTVTKLGFPYADDLQWRYVQILDKDNTRHRLFYVLPGIVLGLPVEADQPIGCAQDISRRYPHKGMLPHVHYECIDSIGEYINPTRFNTTYTAR